MRSLLLVSLLALAFPYCSAAQSTTPTSPPRPRYFIGLGASAGVYRSDSEFLKSGPSPEVTVGVRLHPRWAVEASLTRARKEEVNEYIADQTYNPGPLRYVRAETNQTLLILPLLVRFTPFAPSTKRLHFDLLAGATVAQVKRRNNFMVRDATQVVTYSNISDTDVAECYLDFGASLRFEATSHLEVLANGLGQLSVTRPNPYGGNVCGSISGSLRYNFGGR